LEAAAVAAAGTSDFESWLDARPDAVDYASHRAALEGGGDDAIRYHEYVQWQMDEQLDALARSLEARGQALYLDLPVGTHPDGYDVVSQPELFLRDASVGAPPDAFQPQGQDWGFPPIDPAAARRTGYRYLRACLDTHMRYARLLRIDHVMGLHRLWVIPRGMPPTQGAYLRYAAEEQWAVLCLAAAQHGASIVGENLGTVPEVTNAALERHGALGSWVAEFDMPAPPPRLSLAAIGTHDLPTFATWWHELSPSDRGVVLGALRSAGVLDETFGDLLEPHEVLEGLLAWLGSGDAQVVMVALEDLWLEADAQNEPGSQTHQNFCRRAAYGLDDLDSLEMLKRTLDRLDAARKRT
jgi:4-alpha-glucanotransferase